MSRGSKLGEIGERAWDGCREFYHVSGVLGGVVYLALKPSHWRRTSRHALARQIVLTGVDSLRFIFVAALLLGILVVVQAEYWGEKFGQRQWIAPLLVAVVVRELGPLFANFVVIVNSGSAITTELGIMKVSGEVRALEAQGIDPFLFLIMPRVIGMALAAFGLTLLFICLTFVSGYLFCVWAGFIAMDPSVFGQSLLSSIQGGDLINVVVKSVVGAMITGTICTTNGLGVGSEITEVPHAAKRSLSYSLLFLFLMCAVVSLLTYYR